jgi:hypothetical protein
LKGVCKFCGKEFERVVRHQNSCRLNPERRPIHWQGTILCNDGKVEKRFTKEEFETIDKHIWKRGLTDSHKKKLSKIGHKSRGIANDPDAEIQRRLKISQTMKRNGNSGGYRNGSGRGKSGYYNGIWCDSTWELAYLIWCLDNHIDIRRCKERLTYKFEGKEHWYIPDFIIDNTTIVEIKGYESRQWLAKRKAYPQIEVIDDYKIEQYLTYVKDKYNVKDLTELYERS